ncbi:hypothetical protein N431DRAFT_460235 [Stipitochalara longipes BDJ]|nr:hypothetical protein N431DRAFT_460235 [Stipitochalara longipes BDJ]
MHEMTTTKTQNGRQGIQLTASSNAGRFKSTQSSPTRSTSSRVPRPPPRASLAESYDPEIREARIARFIPVEPARSHPLRVRVRSFLPNGTARRTLHVTVLFGIITLIYQGVSLVPSLGGLNYQAQSNANGQQTLAYAFLQECVNRKVQKTLLDSQRDLQESSSKVLINGFQAQNLPLGPDCLKYLAMTPKAPPDIERWMVDPPSLNPKNIHLIPREVFLVARSFLCYQKRQPRSTVPRYEMTLFGFLGSHKCVFVMVLLALVYIFYPQLFLAMSKLHTLLFSHTHAGLSRQRSIKQFGVWILLLTVVIYSLVFLFRMLFSAPTGWAATSEFLNTCHLLRDNNLPLGPDCTKYLTKQLKPNQYGYSNIVMDHPRIASIKNNRSLSIDTMISLVFGTISLVMGIMVIIIAFGTYRASRVHTQEVQATRTRTPILLDRSFATAEELGTF